MNRSNKAKNWISDNEEEDDTYDDESEDFDGDEENDGGDITNFTYREEYTRNSYYSTLKQDCLVAVKQVLQKNSEVNCTNVLALNKVMQDKLVEVRSNLLSLLQRSKRLYEANEKKLKRAMFYKPNRGIGIRGAYLKGGTFYFKGNMFFKDVNCRNCPNNPDYIYRKEVEGEVFPMDFELSGRHVWAMSDKVSVVLGIKEQVIDYLALQKKHKPTKFEKEYSLHSQKLCNLLENVDSGFKIDWELISGYNLKHRHSPYSANAMWNVYLKPSLNHNLWTEEENIRLLAAVKIYNYQDWQSISELLGNRSDYQCFIQFHNTVCFLLDKKFAKWTKAEDKRLIDLVNNYTMNGMINWNAVASRFPNRTKMKCVSRYYYSVDPNISHAPFTPEEDLTLLAAVEEYGDNFGCIPRALFPHRSSAQLRGRYRNTLVNRDKINAWSHEDDKKLIDFVGEYGPSSWRKCADTLGNHTRTSCRTRFLTIKKFLERNPNAEIEDIPTKMRCPDNIITTNNWTEKIAELRNDPNLSFKPAAAHRKKPIECVKKKQSVCAKRKESVSKPDVMDDSVPKTTIKKPIKQAKPQRRKNPYTEKLRTIELKMYQFFKYSYNFKLGIDPCTKTPSRPHTMLFVKSACGFNTSLDHPFITDGTLPHNIAKSCHIMLSADQKDNFLNVLGYRLPPSWATLMGFRALCVQSSQVPAVTPINFTPKRESTEAIELFRRRLRVLFYKTGLLSRLNPENIASINTRHKSQIAVMNDYCNKTNQSINSDEDLVNYISTAKTNRQIGKGKRRMKNPDAVNEMKKLKTFDVESDEEFLTMQMPMDYEQNVASSYFNTFTELS